MEPTASNLEEYSRASRPGPVFYLANGVALAGFFYALGALDIWVRPGLPGAGTAGFFFGVGSFVLVGAVHSARVVKSAGATSIRVDDQGIIVKFRNGATVRQAWAGRTHPFEVRWIDPAPGYSPVGYGELRLFWRPRTRMPTELAQEIVQRAKAASLQVMVDNFFDRRQGPVTRCRIRSLRHAAG